MENKKNLYIENIFISTKNVLYETPKAIKIKVEAKEKNAFVWIAKKFIYSSKYENSLCIGIVIENSYEIMQEDIKANQKSLYKKVKGYEILQIFKKTKEKQGIVNKVIFKEDIIPDWLKEKLAKENNRDI